MNTTIKLLTTIGLVSGLVLGSVVRAETITCISKTSYPYRSMTKSQIDISLPIINPKKMIKPKVQPLTPKELRDLKDKYKAPPAPVESTGSEA